MHIVDVLQVAVRSGFFADDQAAIRAGARHDGFTYSGFPVTPGFRAIRQPGEAVSVMLLLDDGQVAYGDCASM
jgi:methylaspartate ammonia-lyase